MLDDDLSFSFFHSRRGLFALELYSRSFRLRDLFCFIFVSHFVNSTLTLTLTHTRALAFLINIQMVFSACFFPVSSFFPFLGKIKTQLRARRSLSLSRFIHFSLFLTLRRSRLAATESDRTCDRRGRRPLDEWSLRADLLGILALEGLTITLLFLFWLVRVF